MDFLQKNINSIILGDSYELIKQIPDNSIDCIYTDIPYLYFSGGNGLSELGKRLENNKKQLENISDGINYDIFNEFIRISKKLNCFIWCSKLQINDIMNYFLSKDYNFEILTWNKTNPTPSTNNKWLSDIEYCLYFREKGVRLNDGYELKKQIPYSTNK